MAQKPPTQKPLAPDRKVWERQPDEPESAWAVFQRYRDGGEERSIRAACEANGKWRNQGTRWAVQWRWRERANAWDRHLDTAAQKVRVKECEDMARMHAGLANNALGVLQEPVRELVRRIRAGEIVWKDLNDIALLKLVRQSAAAIKDLVAVERVARGLPESISAIGVGVGAGNPATVAAAIAALFAETPLDDGQFADALKQLTPGPAAGGPPQQEATGRPA